MFGSVDLGARALDYHLERHNLLSSNVANVETPGFRPLELLRQPAGESGLSLPMAATRAGHVGFASASGDHLSVTTETVVQPGGDDNSVSLERELAKVGANRLRYESAAQIVQMHLGTLRYAAEGSGG